MAKRAPVIPSEREESALHKLEEQTLITFGMTAYPSHHNAKLSS